jgi:hypothetical protein
MRLLSVSHSFCAHVPELGRYRLSRGGAMPRFGRVSKRPVVVRQATQVELPIGDGVGREAKPAGAGDRLKAAASKGRGVGIWRRMMEAVARLWSRWMWAGVRRGVVRQPVQTAFLLESVKVVRNDLSDADNEVARPGPARQWASEPGGGKPGVRRSEGSRPGARRTAARWLTAGRTG